MRSTEKKIATALSQNGYKLTPQRRLVLKVIAGSQEHLTPATWALGSETPYDDLWLAKVNTTYTTAPKDCQHLKALGQARLSFDTHSRLC